MDKKWPYQSSGDDEVMMSDIEFTDLIIDIALGRVQIVTKPDEDSPCEEIVFH